MFNIGEKIFDHHDLPAYLERVDFSNLEDLKVQFADYSGGGTPEIMMRRADELDIILYGEYERNDKDYMRILINGILLQSNEWRNYEEEKNNSSKFNCAVLYFLFTFFFR